MRWPWTPRVLTRQALGALGERHAARALRAQGLRLLEANYRRPQGEIDIIAREDDTLIIVEVRTRTSTSHHTPRESVNAAKQAQLVRMAHCYIREHRLDDVHCRYDVVEILATPTGKILNINHIPGAFIVGLS